MPEALPTTNFKTIEDFFNKNMTASGVESGLGMTGRSSATANPYEKIRTLKGIHTSYSK